MGAGGSARRPDSDPVRRAFHDCNAPPTGPVFLALPMDVMEEMTSAGVAETSTIDRAAVAGSLDRLADYLAAVVPGKLAIVAGDEISASNAAAETVRLAEAFARRSMDRPGRCTSRFLLLIRCGPATCRPRRARWLEC
jgi:thiamine pyrophosphate-dependent acetolactate synthase large subunit-like protein